MEKEKKVFISEDNLFDAHLGDVEFLIEELLPIGELVILAGPKAAMKSLFSLELALRIATGTPFCGEMDAAQRKVIFAEREDRVDTTIRRFRTIALATGIREQDLREHARKFLRIATKDFSFSIQNISDVITAEKADLLVLSSFTHLLTDNEIQNEIDNIAIAKLMSQLSAIAEQTRCTILLIHHFSKFATLNGANGQGATRGASSIENVARQIITLQRHRKDKSVIEVNLDNCNYRHLLKENFHVEFNGTFRTAFDPEEVEAETKPKQHTYSANNDDDFDSRPAPRLFTRRKKYA